MNLKCFKVAIILYNLLLVNSNVKAQITDPALLVKHTLEESSIYEVNLDTKTLGREFEGFGALSAGASSRLLYDYPEPQRSDILDYLFKPNYGANLQHLKVEIGGDVNSTDGSEPSHAITRDEFENPRPEYFFRGYEWWLMKEAKKRNPDIILEGLQWGAPGWIGNGTFFSKDNAEFISSWIKGMKKFHHLDIDFVGILNERTLDNEYIKLFRKILDKNDFQKVKIDAGDLWEPHYKWKIADDMVKDIDLKNAVSVINAHTTGMISYYTPPSANELNIPLWDGEAHAPGSDWYAAAEHARFIRAYPYGKITKVIFWSLITSYHDFLVCPYSGTMKANTPWSGYYEVQPPIWVMAHTNQFAKLGWKYIDSACKSWTRSRELKIEGFTAVALKSNTSNDYSIIIETMDAKEPKKVKIKISDDLSKNKLKVWRSVFNSEEFNQLEDIELIDGMCELTVLPNAIYSLTTTIGQSKGTSNNLIPENTRFPFPYTTDFEEDVLATPGKFFSDQNGTFEVVKNPSKTGKCLKQQLDAPGIEWRAYNFPETIIGDVAWEDYSVSVDVMLPDTGTVKISGRRNDFYGPGPFKSYTIHFSHDGKWKLFDEDKLLGSGSCKFYKDKWHSVKINFKKDVIEVFLDNRTIISVNSSTHKNGLVVLGTDWNIAYFDNLKMEEIKPKKK